MADIESLTQEQWDALYRKTAEEAGRLRYRQSQYLADWLTKLEAGEVSAAEIAGAALLELLLLLALIGLAIWGVWFGWKFGKGVEAGPPFPPMPGQPGTFPGGVPPMVPPEAGISPPFDFPPPALLPAIDPAKLGNFDWGVPQPPRTFLPMVTPQDVAEHPVVVSAGLYISATGLGIGGSSNPVQPRANNTFDFNCAGEGLLTISFDPNTGETGVWRARNVALDKEWFLLIPGLTDSDPPIGTFTGDSDDSFFTVATHP